MGIYACGLPVWQLLLMNDFAELLLLCQIETMGTHAISPLPLLSSLSLFTHVLLCEDRGGGRG